MCGLDVGKRVYMFNGKGVLGRVEVVFSEAAIAGGGGTTGGAAIAGGGGTNGSRGVESLAEHG